MTSGSIDLTQFPQALATQLGIGLFPAQILASLILLMLPLLPTLLITKGKNGVAALFVGMASLSLCVGLGWFPVWIMIVICLMIAFLFGKQIIGVFQ